MLHYWGKLKNLAFRKEYTSFIGTCLLKNEIVKIIF